MQKQSPSPGMPISMPDVTVPVQATPVKQSVDRRFFQVPVSYVLDVLPAAVGGRVKPIYTNWAQPAVAKVDSMMFAAADKGKTVIGKVRGNDDTSKKPGLLIRALLAGERTVDWALPEPALTEDSARQARSASYQEDQVSAIRRAMNLCGMIRSRVLIHMEVKFIMVKVQAKVWYDLNVAPPCKIVKDKTLNVRDYGLQKGAVVKDAVTSRALVVKSKTLAVGNAVTSKAFALKSNVVARTFVAKNAVSTRVNAVFVKIQQLLKPVTDRLTLVIRALVERQRRAAAYAQALVDMSFEKVLGPARASRIKNGASSCASKIGCYTDFAFQTLRRNKKLA